MKDLFVDYDTALKLKELGFKERCFGAYKILEDEYIFSSKEGDLILGLDADKKYAFVIKASLKTQVFEWFRNEFCINGDIISNYERYFTYDIDGQFQDEICSWNYSYKISWIEGSKDYLRFTKDLEKVTCYEEYSKAENECINQLIKLINEKV